MSQSSESNKKRSINERFWDMYQHKGAGLAMLLLADEFEFDEDSVRTALPGIIAEGNERGISTAKFLEEYERAIRTDNDGGGIPAVSSDEDDKHQDADGASQARDADGEDQE